MIQKDLINVLGISLKGITEEEAIHVSQVKKSELIWKNVWKTLDISSNYSDNLRTIVTLVFTIENRKTADYKMMEYYDNYLHHLWDKADALELERQRLQKILDDEKMKLVKLEQAVKVLNDQWTVVTADGKLSAHYEHSIAVTNNGIILLTKVD